jgi:ElaB/YqjD/DUF883 family membrane-anchored ribosome-binding protein
MALMDDLKKKTEEGLKTLRETAQDFAFNVEKQAKIGKRKYVDITKLQRNIQKLFAEMGEYAYDELTSGRVIKKNDPYMKERTDEILRMKAEINAIEDEIADIEHTEPPKRETD